MKQEDTNPAGGESCEAKGERTLVMTRRGATGWILGAGAFVMAGLMGVPLEKFFVYPVTPTKEPAAPPLSFSVAGPNRMQRLLRRISQPWENDGKNAAADAANWTDLGAVAQYQGEALPRPITVELHSTDGWQVKISRRVVYLSRDAQGQLQILSGVCPHLGCTVGWDAAHDQFHCPCHNSIFSPDGSYVAGPAPRGMDALPIRVHSGRLQVRYEYYRNLTRQKILVS